MFSRPRSGAAGVLAALTLVIGACAAQNGSPSTDAGPSSSVPGTVAGSVPGANVAAAKISFPGADWHAVDPASVGFDPAGLTKLADAARDGGSNCLVVTRHGQLVAEHYWNDTNAHSAQEVFSATKSYTSALVGIAQDDGKLSLDDSASNYIPAWKGTPAEQVTVRNLVANDSGRHWDFDTDYVKMAAVARDKTAFAIDLPQDAKPGDVWAYNNSAIQTLSQVVRVATGEEPAAYAQQRLLGPIGMNDSKMTADAVGNTLMFMGLKSTCLDMARFGLLMLAKGSWSGKQIVSSAWVDDATGHPSQPLNAGYGYLWWLNRKGPQANAISPTSATEEAGAAIGQKVPAAPEDVYWAAGLGNQVITVFPSSGVVSVRLGPRQPPTGTPEFGLGQLTVGTQEALTAP